MRKEYRIMQTEIFERIYNSLSKEERQRIDRIKEQLRINPYVGKPLGYKFFREKKLNGFRIYYLVYENYLIVYMITRSDKKLQQRTIDYIKSHLRDFKEEIESKRIRMA